MYLQHCRHYHHRGLFNQRVKKTPLRPALIKTDDGKRVINVTSSFHFLTAPTALFHSLEYMMFYLLLFPQDNALYKSCKNVFGENTNLLLCHWHVRRYVPCGLTHLYPVSQNSSNGGQWLWMLSVWHCSEKCSVFSGLEYTMIT